MPMVGGLYSGIEYHAYNVNTPEEIAEVDSFLDSIVSSRQEDSVVSLSMVPTDFVQGAPLNLSIDKYINKPNSIDNYVPRNKKLFTYPYCFLTVDALNSSHNYRYEWFTQIAGHSSNEMLFQMHASVTANMEILLSPYNYNGSNSESNYTESLTMNGFPQVAFTIDSYRAWIANRSGGEIIKAAGTAVASLASLATGNIVGGVLGAMGLASQYNQMTLDQTEGSKVRGTAGASAEVACKAKNFYFKKMSVTNQYAKMIDNFLDRYGYSTCRVKVPNRDVRPHWTYTKTKDCSLRGNVPADDLAKIKEIYNKGITFWKNKYEVGNYTLDNRV